MPVTMKNMPGGQVQVSTQGRIKAKATSFQKAMAQKWLLGATSPTGGKDPMPMMKKKKMGGGMSGGIGGM